MATNPHLGARIIYDCATLGVYCPLDSCQARSFPTYRCGGDASHQTENTSVFTVLVIANREELGSGS